MTIIPPVAGINVGHSTGGGLLDTFKNAISGITGGSTSTTQTTTQTSSGDGSVGLFDGVLSKALIGGALGAGVGFLPFIPGGPVLGGIVGALGGAALGVFSNWQKQQKIRTENEATLAAMGVQVDDPEIQAVLKSGNVSQLIPMMQTAQGGVTQSGVAQTYATTGSGVQTSAVAGVDYGDVTPEEIAALQRQAIANGVTPGQVVAVGGGGSAVGGGGSAGDAGRPVAPTGTSSSDVSAIAPDQPGVGVSDAADGADAVIAAADLSDPVQAQMVAIIKDLQKQIDLLKKMIEEDEKREAATLQSEKTDALRDAA